MIRRILFVQGAGKGTHDEWDDKLADSLRHHLAGSDDVRYPRMPGEDDPDPAAWKATVRGELARLSDGDVLVGHSFGAAILLRALVDDDPPFVPAALILLAAPFYGPGGWTSDATGLPTRAAGRLPRGMPIRLYHGTRDDTVPFAHFELYRAALPSAEFITVADGTHQFDDDLARVARDIRSLLDEPRRHS